MAVEGGRDKQHHRLLPRWIGVTKKPKTLNRRAGRERLGCSVEGAKIKLTLLYVLNYQNRTKKCKNKQQGLKGLQQIMIIIYDLFDLCFDISGAKALDLPPVMYCNILFCPHF